MAPPSVASAGLRLLLVLGAHSGAGAPVEHRRSLEWMGGLGGQSMLHGQGGPFHGAAGTLLSRLFERHHPAEELFASDERKPDQLDSAAQLALRGEHVLVRMGPFAEPYPFVAACARGWFDLPGYRVECSVPYAIGSHAVAQLDGGLVDIFLLGSTALATALSRGVDVEVVYINRVVYNDEVSLRCGSPVCWWSDVGGGGRQNVRSCGGHSGL
eukprot:scaffold87451_cov30-Tisochrysis_lutea.AAC.2